MASTREVVERRQFQGEDETIIYTITTTPWASSPTNTSAKIFLATASSTFTDQTATLMTGSTSVSNDIVTLPAIASLVAGSNYRVELLFTVSGNTFEPYFLITGER